MNVEETVIVIMVKDQKTGFLDRELGCYKIEENDQLIYNTYAVEKDGGGYQVFLKLTCDRDVADWEYEAIFDYYDTEPLLGVVSSVEEEEECYNPTWKVSFEYVDNIEQMERKISEVLRIHAVELQSVYEAISEKKDEYSNEN